MDAPTTFHLLVNGGFALDINGDSLTVRPASRLTDVLRRAIRDHKPELMRMLRQAASTAQDAWPDRPSWRWEIRHADGAWMTHMVTPFETLAQIRAAYPDALEFRPTHLAPATEDAA